MAEPPPRAHSPTPSGHVSNGTAKRTEGPPSAFYTFVSPAPSGQYQDVALASRPCPLLRRPAKEPGLTLLSYCTPLNRHPSNHFRSESAHSRRQQYSSWCWKSSQRPAKHSMPITQCRVRGDPAAELLSELARCKVLRESSPLYSRQCVSVSALSVRRVAHSVCALQASHSRDNISAKNTVWR